MGNFRPQIKPRSAGGLAYAESRLGGRLHPKGELELANHLTPTELAREAGMDRREVIEKCMELGVPIFQGRIDKTLFLASLKQVQAEQAPAQAAQA
jgi:hypothetical protein